MVLAEEHGLRRNNQIILSQIMLHENILLKISSSHFKLRRQYFVDFTGTNSENLKTLSTFLILSQGKRKEELLQHGQSQSEEAFLSKIKTALHPPPLVVL